MKKTIDTTPGPENFTVIFGHNTECGISTGICTRGEPCVETHTQKCCAHCDSVRVCLVVCPLVQKRL